LITAILEKSLVVDTTISPEISGAHDEQAAAGASRLQQLLSNCRKIGKA